AVGPLREILERCAAQLTRQWIDHERRRLTRLYPAHPGVLAAEIGEGGGDRPGRFLPELVAADAGAVLERDEPVLLRDVRGDAVFAAELALFRDRQQRIPVDRRVMMRRSRRGRRYCRRQVE